MAQQSKVNVRISSKYKYLSTCDADELWFDQNKPTWNGTNYESGDYRVDGPNENGDLLIADTKIHCLYERKGHEWILIEDAGQPINHEQ
jgi:hypothetical protein